MAVSTVCERVVFALVLLVVCLAGRFVFIGCEKRAVLHGCVEQKQTISNCLEWNGNRYGSSLGAGISKPRFCFPPIHDSTMTHNKKARNASV